MTGEEGEGGSLMTLGQSLTGDEKKALYDAIDYHEEAEDGTLEYPKSFVKFRVGFQLRRFVITVQVNTRLLLVNILIT